MKKKCRVCDICGKELTDIQCFLKVKAVVRHVISYEVPFTTHETFDICSGCVNDFKEWVTNKEERHKQVRSNLFEGDTD